MTTQGILLFALQLRKRGKEVKHALARKRGYNIGSVPSEYSFFPLLFRGSRNPLQASFSNSAFPFMRVKAFSDRNMRAT